ncbi:MAG: hypothetical protein ACR2PR_02405 [Pseudohongiellaceae bacterium]
MNTRTLLLGLLLTLSASATAAESWEYKETTDPFTDVVSSRIEYIASDYYAAITCGRGHFGHEGLLFALGTYSLMFPNDSGSVIIQMRVDSEFPYFGLWYLERLSDGVNLMRENIMEPTREDHELNQTLGNHRNTKRLVRQMIAGSNTIIRIKPDVGDIVNATMSLSGFTAALKQLPCYADAEID